MMKKRNILVFFLLEMVTFGLYGIFVYCKIGEEINEICEGDDEEQMHYLLALLLGIVTLGIFPMLWMYKAINRLQDNAYRYGVKVKHSGTEFLLWLVFGMFLAGIGVIIAHAYFLKDVNEFADVYGYVTPLAYTPNEQERARLIEASKHQRNTPPAPRPASNNKPGSILGVRGVYQGANLPIADGEELVIGRDPSQCGLLFEDSFTKISARHVAVRYHAQNGTYDITDYSRNGTYLSNGTRLPKNTTVTYSKGVEIHLADNTNAFQLT